MRTAHALALSLPLLVGTGCYLEIDDGPVGYRTGDLTLRYSFGGAYCLDAGVHRIAVRLEGQRRGEVYRDSFSCARYEDGVTFEGLREDTYDVEIEGRDANGGLLYLLDSGRSVEVIWGSHQEYDVEVPDTGGALGVYWTFDGEGRCGEVYDVRVELYDSDGFVYDDALYPCDYGGVIYDVLAHGVWTVYLDGLDAMGRSVYRSGSRNVVVIRGAQNDYTIDLSSMR